MLGRLVLLGAIGSQMGLCGSEPLPTKPLKEFATSWTLRAEILPDTQLGATPEGRFTLTYGVGRERPAGASIGSTDCFTTDDSFQIQVNAGPMVQVESTVFSTSRFEVCEESDAADPSVQYGSLGALQSTLTIPEGTAPQDLMLTFSDHSASFEMVVPGMVARHEIVSSDASFSVDPMVEDPVTPGQVIHLAHAPQLGWPSVALAWLDHDDLTATSSTDAMEIQLPAALSAGTHVLDYQLRSAPAVSRCDGVGSCSAKVYTNGGHGISVSQ